MKRVTWAIQNIWFHLKRFLSAYISELKKCLFHVEIFRQTGLFKNWKYLGPTVWFNIQLVPKSFSKYYWILLWLWLFMTQVVKYTTKVKVIKYFLQIFDIWNNGAGKKWGVRYTFWYIVLLTLFNGDRRIVAMDGDKYAVEQTLKHILAVVLN